MKILSKYAIREFITPFFLGLFAFTLILLLDEIFDLTATFVEKDVSLIHLLQLLVYVVPATLVVTVPMATLVGLLLTFGRLSADNEIAAINAIGININRVILPPILLVALVLSGIDFLIMDYALPWGNSSYISLMYDINMRNPALVLQEDTVMEEMAGEGKKWYFKSQDRKSGKLKDVKVWEDYVDGKPKLIIAKEGIIDTSSGKAVLKLYRGFIYESDYTKPIYKYTRVDFNEQEIQLNISESLKRETHQISNYRAMSMKKLKARINELKRELGKNPPISKYANYSLWNAIVEYQKKMSIPFACLVFGLIGMPLGIMTRRSGKMVGLGIGLCVIIFYYVVLRAGETIGKRGVIPPSLGVWIPNILTAIFGAVLLIRSVQKHTVRAHKWIERLFPREPSERENEM